MVVKWYVIKQPLSVMAISVLKYYCLSQNISLHSNGLSLIFVFGSLRKTQKVKINKHKYNGSSTGFLASGESFHITAERTPVIKSDTEYVLNKYLLKKE